MLDTQQRVNTYVRIYSSVYFSIYCSAMCMCEVWTTKELKKPQGKFMLWAKFGGSTIRKWPTTREFDGFSTKYGAFFCGVFSTLIHSDSVLRGPVTEVSSVEGLIQVLPEPRCWPHGWPQLSSVTRGHGLVGKKYVQKVMHTAVKHACKTTAYYSSTRQFTLTWKNDTHGKRCDSWLFTGWF